jgi:hypothetical protein
MTLVGVARNGYEDGKGTGHRIGVEYVGTWLGAIVSVYIPDGCTSPPFPTAPRSETELHGNVAFITFPWTNGSPWRLRYVGDCSGSLT